ncbi:MAG: superoxide dismutase family protein [Flavobacteriaceae bacterium]
MKNLIHTFLIASIVLVGCKDENKKTEEAQDNVEEIVNVKEVVKDINLELEPKSESTAMGKVEITEKDGIVTLNARLLGLTPGMHAIHIHEKADCSAADATSSGGHWNPTMQPHGKWGAETGYHKGDIGNFEADANGEGTITLTTSEWCIGCGDESKDILGKAIIVHQGVDDFTTQPTGNAGGRVSCGGIIQ